MLKRFLQKNLGLILAFLFIFFAGWQVGYAGFQLSLSLNPPEIKIVNQAPPSQTLDLTLLNEVVERINADFLFQPVDAKKLLYGMIGGLVEALGDPYSAFLSPEENQSFNLSLEGVYEGIGAEIGIRENQLIIVAPLSGSPAEGKGVRSGDAILEINGESTAGLTVVQAVVKIRGDAGTAVTLTLRRGQDPEFEVTITRARITVASVTTEDKGNGIWLIELSRFGEKTNSEWDQAISSLKSKTPNPKGIVLDLRDNPGGYLSAAVYVASEFLREGTVVIQEDASGGRQNLSVQDTENGHFFFGVPVVVLINGGSASASEILAAALAERAGSQLVGEKSFGKGTVQDAVDFADGSGLHLSVAKWLTPLGNWVHDVGLIPDFALELTDEDRNAGRDPQLIKALDLLP